MALEYTCSICHTKATIYYAGQYRCRKCKRKYFVDKALNLIGENDEDEEDDVDTRTANHRSNYIPLHQRIIATICGLGFLIYGIWGVSMNDLPLPFGSRGNAFVVHLNGIFKYIGFFGLFCLFCESISFIIDHYDKRNNESTYKRIQESLEKLAFSFYCISALLQLIWQIVLAILKQRA